MKRQYTYKCNKCNHTEVIELDWGSDIPNEWKCLHCQEGKMQRDLLADLRSTDTHIPNNFKAIKRW